MNNKVTFKAKPVVVSPPALMTKFFEMIPKTNIDFIGLRYYFYGLTGLLILGTFALLFVRGAPLGIDFTGGVVVEFELPRDVAIESVRSALGSEGLETSVQTMGAQGQFMGRFKKEEELKGLDDKIHHALTQLAPEGSYHILRKEFVGAVVGERLRNQALMAIAFSFLGIIVYVGFRFRNLVWGTAGVVALMHDVISTVGFITLTHYEIDLVMVAALLTIAGYSINDTVVIYDRLRERVRLHPKESLEEAINKAVNETLSRTIITTGTVFLAVLSLVIFGGANLRSFSMAMLFGTLIGAYSTVGVASNLIYSWQRLSAKSR